MKNLSALLALMSIPGFVHALSGEVSDRNGNPVQNATIEVVGSTLQIRTDAQGKFNLPQEAGTVDEVHIAAPGFSHRVLHLHDEQPEYLQITLERSAIEHVDVTGIPLHTSIMESAQPVTVVSGDNLRRKQAATLGETLKNEVGVHSSYFGPVSSSPIIRGLDGPRVLITQNGLDTSDASRIGPDHVVATETATAEQIEILRGPATLFFGSGAIGGVVNVVDDRVPKYSESRGAFYVGHNSVADENEVSAAYSGGNDNFAFHVDGFWRDGNDYKIPGIAVLESEEEHEEEGHEEHDEGVLDNSAAESEGYNIGASWLMDNGYIGLAYGRLERLNGIPGHSHTHHEEHEEEDHEEEDHQEGEELDEEVLSDLTQNRWQLLSELTLDTPWVSGLHTRIGYTDYEHAEVENGETGTVFRNETLQARFDLLLQEFAGWRGALSLEGRSTDFEASGEEAFTPPSNTESFAIALMQEKHHGSLLWQLGARVERVTIEADPIEWQEHHHEEEHEEHEEEDEGSTLLHFEEIDFTPYSLSAGLVWNFAANYNTGLSIIHAQRAPSAAELYSFGPHIGTGSFEVGALFRLHDTEEPHFHYDNDVEEEASNNIDLSLRKHAGDVGWVVNLFYNKVDHFLYERATGYDSEDFSDEHDHEEEESAEEEMHEHEENALPVYVFEQADATLYGVEAQIAWQFSTPLKLTFWGDAIRGKLDDGGNLPRIPPARIGGLLQFHRNGWEGELGATHYFEQDRVATLETTTDGYTLLDAELAYTFAGNAGDLTVFLKGRNLTDEEARVHSSFLKNRAPLPGRGLSVGLRGTF